MAVHKFIDNGGHVSPVVIDGATIRILQPLALEAPKATAILRDVPWEQQTTAIENLLEQGATTAAAVQASAHVVMLEGKLAELTATLRNSLDEQLRTAGANAAEVTEKLLEDHKGELTKLVMPLYDANAKNGLPAKMVELLDIANRNAMQHIGVMLKDGEEGAIGKAVKQITDQVKETGLAITRALAEREALLTKSNRRGTRFEDVLEARLPALVRVLGRVERCATVQGDKARNAGDYIIALEGAPEAPTIVLEAKSQQDRLSPNEIRKELKLARENRGASAAVFVACTADILPGGIGFGQVSDCDYYVAFDPAEGDETCLTCALYMARVAALATVTAVHSEAIDVAAIQREAAALRALLTQFSKIEVCHSKVDKEISNARAAAADLKAEILTALRRLDGLPNP